LQKVTYQQFLHQKNISLPGSLQQMPRWISCTQKKLSLIKESDKYHALILKSLRLQHTSQFSVIELQISCQGQIGLKFVGPPACRTLAEFLSRLTTLRLGTESSKIKMAPIPRTRLSWHFPIGWGVCEPRQIVLVHRTLADKARQDILRSSTVRYHQQTPISSQTCLNSPDTSQQVKSFLSAYKKSASVQQP